MQRCIGLEGSASEETSVAGLQPGSWRDIRLVKFASFSCVHTRTYSYLLVLTRTLTTGHRLANTSGATCTAEEEVHQKRRLHGPRGSWRCFAWRDGALGQLEMKVFLGQLSILLNLDVH